MDDEDREIAREARCRKAIERLGVDDPQCLFCDEDDPRCLEKHHLAGRAHSNDIVIVCRNHHAKLTDLQSDHPPKVAPQKDLLEVIGRFLSGLADLFIMLAGRLREFGEALIATAATSASSPDCGGRT